MHFVWWLVAAVACDNIEIDVADVDVVYCVDSIVHASEIRHANSIKISHLGDIRLGFLMIEPRVLLIYDRTIYFARRKPIVYRIDFEYKILGMASFVWVFVGFCIVYSLSMVRIAYLVFGHLDRSMRRDPKTVATVEDYMFVDALYNGINASCC